MFNNTTFTNVTNSTNGTGPGPGPRRPPSSFQVDVAANVFFCILALMIVFENSLVIGAFRVNRRLRTTPNLLLMSLAIADMLTGTISVPLWVYISVKYINQGPLYKFYLIFDVICGVSSILNLTAISLERCYALLHPIKHRNIKKRSVLAIIFVAWVLASLAGSMREFLPKKYTSIYGIIVTVPFFFTPLIVILAAYGTIFHIARKHARGRGVSSFKKDLRIVTTVAVVIGLFIVCWTPFFTIAFAFGVCIYINFKGVGCAGLTKVPQVILQIPKWLQYGNSVCNPIIYGFRNKEFRLAFRKILLGLCCRKVRLSDYRKKAYERPNLQKDFLNQVPMGLIDRRDDCKAIQSGHSEPKKLEFLERGLPGDLLEPSADVFHASPSANDLSGHPVALCNPAFEGPESIDQGVTETRF